LKCLEPLLSFNYLFGAPVSKICLWTASRINQID
jgi:hypothetical protein